MRRVHFSGSRLTEAAVSISIRDFLIFLIIVLRFRWENNHLPWLTVSSVRMNPREISTQSNTLPALIFRQTASLFVLKVLSSQPGKAAVKYQSHYPHHLPATTHHSKRGRNHSAWGFSNKQATFQWMQSWSKQRLSCRSMSPSTPWHAPNSSRGESGTFHLILPAGPGDECQTEYM